MGVYNLTSENVMGHYLPLELMTVPERSALLLVTVQNTWVFEFASTSTTSFKQFGPWQKAGQRIKNNKVIGLIQRKLDFLFSFPAFVSYNSKLLCMVIHIFFILDVNKSCMWLLKTPFFSKS